MAKNTERIEQLKRDANPAKATLISIMNRLEDAGAIKEAQRLEKIIINLEVWQNR